MNTVSKKEKERKNTKAVMEITQIDYIYFRKE